MTRLAVLLGTVGYAALVAHLLFIPYAFTPLTPAEAAERVLRMPWLELGSDQNIALVSRGLMFFPLGVLIAAACAVRPSGWGRQFAVVSLATMLGATTALGINIGQLWFPARTFSLNNLVAESVGVFAGAMTWVTAGARASDWWRNLARGGASARTAVLHAYALIYVFALLLPLDFVTNVAAFEEKLASGLYAIWHVAGTCGAAPCTLKYTVTLCLAIPFGWWIAQARPQLRHDPVRRIALPTLFSAAIEAISFFMVSGHSEGASMLVRAVGVIVGIMSFDRLARLHLDGLEAASRPVVSILALPYLFAVAYVCGWTRSSFTGLRAGVERIDSIVLMPFYHQYYAPYSATMQSVLVQAAMYAPIAVACWLWSRERWRSRTWVAPAIAVPLALVAESSKLLLEARFPDYTDAFFAATSSWLVAVLLRFVSRAEESAPSGTAGGGRVSPSIGDAQQRAGGLRVSPFGTAALVVSIATVVNYPSGRWALAAGLITYAVLLLRRPQAYLLVIPAALVGLDFAPFTGRFFWDEVDAVLATTVGVRLLQGSPRRVHSISVPRGALTILLASVSMSAVVTILSSPTLDSNAFSSYLSGYNGLRIAKGYLWAGALLWLIARDKGAGLYSERAAIAGLALGLATCVAGVVYEWLVLVGPTARSDGFRAAGLVSATHIGGAYLEVVLVLLAPFGLALAASESSRTIRSLAVLLVLLDAVAVVQTVSRTAFVAWVLVVIVFALALWRASAAHTRPGWISPARIGAIALLCLAGAGVALVQSSFLRARLVQSAGDFSIRVAHWMDVFDMMRGDPRSILLGAGLGSFPREYYLRTASEGAAAFRVESMSIREPSRLLMIGGKGLYLDQRIFPDAPGVLRVSGRVRSDSEDGVVSVFLCIKSFMYSLSCSTADIGAGRTWKVFAASLAIPSPSASGPWQPMVLAVHNGRPESKIELTELSLLDGATELLRNGSFSAGLDHWFMASDLHLVWRTKNTILQVAFEQGVLGAIAWTMLVFAMASRWKTANMTPVLGSAILAGMCGFAIVGAFDHVLDSPRIVELLALSLSGAIIGVRIRSARASARLPGECPAKRAGGPKAGLT